MTQRSLLAFCVRIVSLSWFLMDETNHIAGACAACMFRTHVRRGGHSFRLLQPYSDREWTTAIGSPCLLGKQWFAERGTIVRCTRSWLPFLFHQNYHLHHVVHAIYHQALDLWRVSSRYTSVTMRDGDDDSNWSWCGRAPLPRLESETDDDTEPPQAVFHSHRLSNSLAGEMEY